ncbi:MAG: hypothetical protein BWY82_00643 [Verrucomicrobia bacterium ADurb.Bin474]|nr:MAG: hypothetical protein BWY82_00643 [Verrucomicrobia bacterium ADurb.Bin474]
MQHEDVPFALEDGLVDHLELSVELVEVLGQEIPWLVMHDRWRCEVHPDRVSRIVSSLSASPGRKVDPRNRFIHGFVPVDVWIRKGDTGSRGGNSLLNEFSGLGKLVHDRAGSLSISHWQGRQSRMGDGVGSHFMTFISHLLEHGPGSMAPFSGQ